MSEALKMTAFAAAAAAAAFLLRAANRQAGAAVAMAAGLMLFVFATEHLSAAAALLREMGDRAGIGEETAGLLMKLAAMAYLTEFSVQACRDAGEEGLAARAALCGKALLMAETLPLAARIGELALSLTP